VDGPAQALDMNRLRLVMLSSFTALTCVGVTTAPLTDTERNDTSVVVVDSTTLPPVDIPVPDTITAAEVAP
jgi:hypothetical protein